MPSLLAVDAGLHTGLALYDQDGRLRWYRSQHFGSRARLRRGVFGLLNGLPDLARLVVEGGGTEAVAWEREAARRRLVWRQISAETWRRHLFYRRERRTGALAKQHADTLARHIIAWSGAARPTSLRHDAAEAILIGLWGVLDAGWLDDLPADLRR